MADEVGYAKHRANLIRLDGGSPDVSPPPEKVRAMHAAVIDAERTDVANYVRFAALAKAVESYSLKLKMDEQVADES